jgi:hypothetical protein
MSTNLDMVLREFEELKGQFVINNAWNIERFVAIAGDNYDYYYVTYNGRKLTWYSTITKIIPLKGKIDDIHYNELIKIAKLNHYDQPTLHGSTNITRKKEIIKFNKNHIEEITNLYKPDNKYITDIYWEIH